MRVNEKTLLAAVALVTADAPATAAQISHKYDAMHGRPAPPGAIKARLDGMADLMRLQRIRTGRAGAYRYALPGHHPEAPTETDDA